MEKISYHAIIEVWCREHTIFEEKCESEVNHEDCDTRGHVALYSRQARLRVAGYWRASN